MLLMLAACANISTDAERRFASQNRAVTISAVAEDGLLSRFSGPLRVQEATVMHPWGFSTPTVSVNATANGIAATVTSAVDPFDVSDLLFVRWEGDTVDWAGSAAKVSRLTITGFAWPRLCMELEPAGSLPSGGSGVAKLRFTLPVASATDIKLASQVLSLSATQVSVPAGQTTPSVLPTTNIGTFSCPNPGHSGNVSEGWFPQPCSEKNGVLATANYGSRNLQVCVLTSRRCPRVCPDGTGCDDNPTVPILEWCNTDADLLQR
jgi:hypothetical protein